MTVKAADRLALNPNLCKTDDLTNGESKRATIELFTTAVNHGFNIGVFKIVLDVLTFIGQDEQYVQDWGDPNNKTRLIALMMDASDEKIKEAIAILEQR